MSSASLACCDACPAKCSARADNAAYSPCSSGWRRQAPAMVMTAVSHRADAAVEQVEQRKLAEVHSLPPLRAAFKA